MNKWPLPTPPPSPRGPLVEFVSDWDVPIAIAAGDVASVCGHGPQTLQQAGGGYKQVEACGITMRTGSSFIVHGTFPEVMSKLSGPPAATAPPRDEVTQLLRDVEAYLRISYEVAELDHHGGAAVLERIRTVIAKAEDSLC